MIKPIDNITEINCNNIIKTEKIVIPSENEKMILFKTYDKFGVLKDNIASYEPIINILI